MPLIDSTTPIHNATKVGNSQGSTLRMVQAVQKQRNWDEEEDLHQKRIGEGMARTFGVPGEALQGHGGSVGTGGDCRLVAQEVQVLAIGAELGYQAALQPRLQPFSSRILQQACIGTLARKCCVY